VLMVGTGEYTTGIVAGNKQSQSDKRLGVVGLVCFELRRMGRVNRLCMVGTSGTKYPTIREHFAQNIQKRYNNLDVSFESFPADHVASDPLAYVAALGTMHEGDICIIFTPDDTHYPIARVALLAGLHVLVTKPLVHTLAQHRELVELAAERNLLLGTEVHKRWDPCYADARHRIRKLALYVFCDYKACLNRLITGELAPLSFFSAFMSQPVFQLDTFRSWAGKSSDISYYLNRFVGPLLSNNSNCIEFLSFSTATTWIISLGQWRDWHDLSL
jgi:D-galacturonate reductase